MGDDGLLHASLTAADVATAGKDTVGVVRGLTPGACSVAVAGPAFTACGRSGDNLVLHRALAEASPGDILVVELEGEVAAGHWGELMTRAAVQAGIAGVVIDGAVRDVRQTRDLGFPVFHRGTAPNPASKSFRGELRDPIQLGGVTVAPGDLVVLDLDGMVVVPREQIEEVLARVQELHDTERELMQRIAEGQTTIEALRLEVT
jgi:4-hydroxy-4-methyl-2-oxoglutarate aldolase